MNGPDTGMRKIMRLGGGRLWWRSTGFVGDATASGAVSGENATVTYRPTAGVQLTALKTAWATRTINAQTNRRALVVDEVTDAISGTLPYGAAWIYTRGDGVIPVRIARVSGTTVHLVDPLPYDLTITTQARIQSALWFADESAAAVVGTVTRTADAGDRPIPYTIEWGMLEPANQSAGFAVGAAVRRVEGTLSVVRQPFDTGLTTDGVFARYPELTGMQQAGSAGVEGAILSAYSALRLNVTSAAREAGAAPYTWADDVSGDAFAECHAAMVAARIVRTTRPDLAQAYSEDAERYFKQGLAVAWADLNRDGVVDAGESPALVGFSTAGNALPSTVPSRAPAWWSMGECR